MSLVELQKLVECCWAVKGEFGLVKHLESLPEASLGTLRNEENIAIDVFMLALDNGKYSHFVG